MQNLHIKWYRQHTNGSRVLIIVGQNFKYVISDSERLLYVQRLTTEDSGFYACEAELSTSQGIFVSNSVSAYLTVTGCVTAHAFLTSFNCTMLCMFHVYIDFIIKVFS